MLDQDTGGGIRASGRCDLYMGIGPQAEELAGREMATGKLYYLAIKPELINQKAPVTEIALHEFFHAARIDRILRQPVPLKRGADDETVGVI